MKNNDTPFLKNADIRAGKIPGWNNRPETNGDPYDKNNKERTDAAMVVSEGMIALNAVSLYSAKYFGIRKVLLTAVCIPFLFAAGYYAYSQFMPGAHGFTKPSLGGAASAKAEPEYDYKNPPAYAKAGEFIDEFYVKPTDGVAQRYNTGFFSQFGYPSKKYDITFSNSFYSMFSERYKRGLYKDVSAKIAKQCEGREFAACLPEITDQIEQFVALSDQGEDMQMYTPRGDQYDDSVKRSDKLEEILSTASKEFEDNRKVIKNYCDSPNRRFANTWGIDQAKSNVNTVIRVWQETGKLVDTTKNINKVGSMKELIALRDSDDKDCNNLNIAFLKVGSGSVKYLMNVSARVHTQGTDEIGTGLYLLGKLDDKNVAALIATNNTKNISIFNNVEAITNSRNIMPGLNKSAPAIAELFEDDKYVIAQNTTKKGE